MGYVMHASMSLADLVDLQRYPLPTTRPLPQLLILAGANCRNRASLAFPAF